ncbi:MAG: hypothetical protein OHK0013_39680 [Sandaracinaceae bacterium]
MRGGRAELVLLREALEAFVAPEVATSILFDALAQAEEPPASLHEMKSFVAGPLSNAVHARVRPDDATQAIRLVQGAIDAAIDRDGVDVEIEFDPTASASGIEGGATKPLSTMSMPVPVVVLAAHGNFAARLELCLGEDRCHAVRVNNPAALRKALFAHAPLLTVLDGTGNEGSDPEEVVEVLRGAPDNVVPVLWAADTPWGQRLRAQAPSRLVALGRSEGIEPLCDLVLSRFRGG